MHKKFEINKTKIKGSCQSGRKVVHHNSKSDLPLYDKVPTHASRVIKNVTVHSERNRSVCVCDRDSRVCKMIAKVDQKKRGDDANLVVVVPPVATMRGFTVPKRP